ncbi:hypothetical protein V8E53_007533 [Lactarius tabidus]
MVKVEITNSSSEQDISETSTLSGTQDVYEPVPVPASIRDAPTNYLHVSKKGAHTTDKQTTAIWGQYFIDLSLPPVPQTVRHVVSGPENLCLRTQSGAIVVEVWVTGNNKLRQGFLKLLSDNGSVDAKVHDAFSGSESEQRPSLKIVITAYNGDVSLSLPRFFRGIMTIISPPGRIVFSPALKKRTALLSDVDGICVYFVGNRPRSWMLWIDDKEGKEGAAGTDMYPEESLDELFVGNCDTGVRIRWDGEPDHSV